MLNKLKSFIRQQELIAPGDRVICALSGGADSVALLWALYLLQQQLGFSLSAAHFNHGLRGEESDRDEAFVRALCDRYDIPLYVDRGQVKAGKKGLEAAARDARYAFLQSLPGKVATAHTADDNAETVLMHMVRGTGLKGLGGIAPKRDNLIRPMLSVTRGQVLTFLAEQHLKYVEDSSNGTDDFLRNRLRHQVMPLLKEENPRFAENTSAMALLLRQDEQALEALSGDTLPDVQTLKSLPQALQNRYITTFLKEQGVKEPEKNHVELALQLVYSDNPSAQASFPGGVTVCRQYDRLTVCAEQEPLSQQELPPDGEVELPGFRIVSSTEPLEGAFPVNTVGTVYIRIRRAGDRMRLQGGSKLLKQLYIDRKIPASQRKQIPVIADDHGVLAVWNFGPNLDRIAEKEPDRYIRFEKI